MTQYNARQIDLSDWLYIKESELYPGEWGVYERNRVNKLGGPYCLVFGLTQTDAIKYIENNGDRHLHNQ